MVFFTGLPREPFFFGVIVTLQTPVVLSLIKHVARPYFFQHAPRLVTVRVDVACFVRVKGNDERARHAKHPLTTAPRSPIAAETTTELLVPCHYLNQKRRHH